MNQETRPRPAPPTGPTPRLRAIGRSWSVRRTFRATGRALSVRNFRAIGRSWSVRRNLRSIGRSLSVRNFRLFFVGQLVSVIGTWMMLVTQDWLVLSLSGDSATVLGLVTALQFAPMLFLSLYGGRLADRHDKRVILLAANLVSAALSLILAPLVFTGAVRVWHVCALAFCLGLVNAIETPARMSFVHEMVGGDLLPNASALSAAYFNLARIFGPALGGLAITWLGIGPVSLLNAASYLATVAALLLMRPGELLRRAGPARDGRTVDALRYVAARPDLLLPLAAVALVGVFGLNFQLTLPLLAKTVFHADAGSFGLFTSAVAVGSLLGALIGTGRVGRPSETLVAGAALAFGAAEALAGLAPGQGTALVLLAVTGLTALYFTQAVNHRVQLGSDPGHRGRILALYTLLVQGSTPFGALLTGWVAAHQGARAALVYGGLISSAVGLAALALRALRTVRVSREGRADGEADAIGRI
ncbi:MFS transporter [Streptomyces sp. NPDC090075]|uniref:MFS transporter n=1 Tax=Streptomyces sp. NPDC090075 TaxID=3365937 RepID=UPI00381A4629